MARIYTAKFPTCVNCNGGTLMLRQQIFSLALYQKQKCQANSNFQPMMLRCKRCGWKIAVQEFSYDGAKGYRLEYYEVEVGT
jgi:hypothetical protein